MTGCRFLAYSALLLLVLGGTGVRADDLTQNRVGRIAVAEGEIAIRLPANAQPDQAAHPGPWADAGVNDPIAEGMSVRTAEKARAVLRIGGDTLALAGGSEAEIVSLDRGTAEIALHRGRIGVRLAELDSALGVNVTIPSGGIRLLAPGEYDILADEGRFPARLAVLAGTARFSGKGLDAVIADGGAVLLTGNDPVGMLPGGTEEDEFVASWRAHGADRMGKTALRHVSPAMTGYEALDEHGAWEVVGGYGAVWFPNELPQDWAPYRSGHWRWVNPWGWTWIDDMPWGFVTSHYGRWVRFGASDPEPGSWGWVPGKKVKNPSYMPAGVAFLGTPGVGLSYPDAFGPAVAWFPLAPNEVYWPRFTDDLAAIRRLNAGAVAEPATIGPALNGKPPADVVTGDYRNRRFATVVPRAVFLGGKPVAEALIDLPIRRLENAPLLAGSPQIEPPTGGQAAAPPSAARRRGIAANLAKARETLSRILRFREARKRTVETDAAGAPGLKPRIAVKRELSARALLKHGKARAHRRARTAAKSGKAQPRSAEAAAPAKSKSRSANLREAEAEGS
jgi:hypothetical protein